MEVFENVTYISNAVNPNNFTLKIGTYEGMSEFLMENLMISGFIAVH